MAALTFGAATSDRVNCGSATSLDNLVSSGGTVTAIAWIYPTAFSGRAIISKQRSSAAVGWGMTVNASSQLRVIHERATTDLQYVANNLTLSANTYYCVAGVIDGTANTGKLYVGSLTTNMTETTYGTTDGGSGTYGADAARSLFIGNVDGTTPNLSFEGDIFAVAVFNRGLTLGELITWQWQPQKMNGCVLYVQCGWNGTGTQPDWSGNTNNGTVTGATASTRGVPLTPVFGRTKTFRYTPAAPTSVTIRPWRLALLGVQ